MPASNPDSAKAAASARTRSPQRTTGSKSAFMNAISKSMRIIPPNEASRRDLILVTIEDQECRLEELRAHEAKTTDGFFL